MLALNCIGQVKKNDCKIENIFLSIRYKYVLGAQKNPLITYVLMRKKKIKCLLHTLIMVVVVVVSSHLAEVSLW